jgi:hypothetical protein
MSFTLHFPGQSSNAQQRFNICLDCENAIVYPAGQLQCHICKCWMNLKTRMPNQHCPIGKW